MLLWFMAKPAFGGIQILLFLSQTLWMLLAPHVMLSGCGGCSGSPESLQVQCARPPNPCSLSLSSAWSHHPGRRNHHPTAAAANQTHHEEKQHPQPFHHTAPAHHCWALLYVTGALSVHWMSLDSGDLVVTSTTSLRSLARWSTCHHNHPQGDSSPRSPSLEQPQCPHR